MKNENSATKFHIVPSRPDMAARLAEIHCAAFPTLAEDHLISADHYRAQIEKFPEGQMMAVDDGGLPVAASGDLRTNIDFDDFQHRYIDMVDHNWLGTHDPAGEWLYGFDISVHPDYQSRGLGKMLYAARHALVRRLGLRGHVAGGMISGYHAHKDRMGAETYVARVVAGEIFDPTLSIQLKRGFKVAGILNDYLDDPSCDNKAALIVWRNPEVL